MGTEASVLLPAHVIQYLPRIGIRCLLTGQQVGAVFHIVQQALIILLQRRGPQRAELRQEQAAFPGITGAGSGFPAGVLVHVSAHAFVDGRIFHGKIIIILIIRIEEFKFPLIQGNSRGTGMEYGFFQVRLRNGLEPQTSWDSRVKGDLNISA